MVAVKYDDPDVVKLFGDNLKALRLAAGLTQIELAQRMGHGTYHSSLAAIEAGSNMPSPSKTIQIALALGVEPWVLWAPKRVRDIVEHHNTVTTYNKLSDEDAMQAIKDTITPPDAPAPVDMYLVRTDTSKSLCFTHSQEAEAYLTNIDPSEYGTLKVYKCVEAVVSLRPTIG